MCPKLAMIMKEPGSERAEGRPKADRARGQLGEGGWGGVGLAGAFRWGPRAGAGGSRAGVSGVAGGRGGCLLQPGLAAERAQAVEDEAHDRDDDQGEQEIG